MVGTKGHLKPICGLFSRSEDISGVVHKYVDLVMFLAEANGELSDRVQVGEIEQGNFHGRAGVGCDCARSRFTTVGMA